MLGMQNLYLLILRNARLTAFRRITIGLLAVYWVTLFVSTHVPIRGMGGSNDKLLHIAAFAGLAFLLAWSVAKLRPTWRAALTVLAIAVAYGALDESTQMLVPRRKADVWDWVANVVGSVLGLLGYLVCLQALTLFWRRFARNSPIVAPGESAP